MALRRSIIWIDAGGRTTQTIPCTTGGAASIQAALVNHSNAGVQEWWEGFNNVLFPSPSAAKYPDVKDLAALTFTDGSGSLVTLSLVAPKGNIFLADGSTVDSSAIADIIAAAIGNLCSSGGGTVTAYVSGIRKQRPLSS